MNFLAHAYLSFDQPGIMVGNMIADFVKGDRQLIHYPEQVQYGIRLHRAIDTFTDHHPATHEAAVFFKKDYRLYSIVFIDVVYDYFLANDINYFSQETLFDFSQKVYTILQLNYTILPMFFRQLFYYMQSQNWLLGYRQTEGAEKAFKGIVRRAKYLDNETAAFTDFMENYNALQSCYQRFFPELIQFVQQYFLQHPLM